MRLNPFLGTRSYLPDSEKSDENEAVHRQSSESDDTMQVNKRLQTVNSTPHEAG
jgi:hypothetical protein